MSRRVVLLSPRGLPLIPSTFMANNSRQWRLSIVPDYEAFPEGTGVHAPRIREVISPGTGVFLTALECVATRSCPTNSDYDRPPIP